MTDHLASRANVAWSFWATMLTTVVVFVLYSVQTSAQPNDALKKTLPEHSARRLLGPQEQSFFAAVGRVKNVTGERHCSGTLIAEDLVLTAAHCVAHQAKGWTAPPYRVIFQAEVRDGRASATRIGRSLSVGEGYMDTSDIADDLALIRLQQPITEDLATPIPVAASSILRERPLAIYSYGYDAPDTLAAENNCRSLAAMDKVMVTNCEAVGGISGAPVLTYNDDGTLVLTAVVSSRLARTGGQPGYGRAVVVPMNSERLAQLISRLTPQ